MVEAEYPTNIYSFKELISLPINAVIDANIEASKSILHFILEFGFENSKHHKHRGHKKKEFKYGKPKMLSFTYDFINAGVPQKMHVELPVLSLMPLPLLTIDRAKFDMGLRVMSRLSHSLHVDGSLNENELASKTLVMLSPTRSNSSKNTPTTEILQTNVVTNMSASVEVVTSDMPQGILQLLNFFQESTKGRSRDKYSLIAVPPTLTFSAESLVQELEITLSLEKKPVSQAEVTFEVISNTDNTIDESFDTVLELLEGNPLGIPTKTTLSGLTTEEGKIKIQLHAHASIAGNGYVKVFNEYSETLFIYYELT